MALTRPELVVLADPEAVAAAAADHVESSAARAIDERGVFRIALAGGGSPRRLYELLASPERAARIRWQDWQIFFGDERAVPPTDAQSNYKMARESLLGQLPIPAENLHRMQGELSPAEAARRYRAELGDAPLDLVLLGMGGDGHTASLFPGDAALEEARERVVAARAPVTPSERITLSLVALAEAREVLFLITGASKAERVHQVFAEIDSGAPVLPSARVAAQRGVWFYLDRAAAGSLGNERC